MNPMSAISGGANSAGIFRQLIDLASTLVNPKKIKGVVGTIAKPLRSMPKDVIDSTKSKEENKDKREPTLLERVFSRVTWLHVIGAFGLIGSFINPIIDKLLGATDENPGMIKNIKDMILNPASGIGALILSEISYNNEWHLQDRERLQRLGVLEDVTHTSKWKQLNVENYFRTGVLPENLRVDQETALLLEIRCSPKHKRATCYEGSNGQGKTFAAYVSAYLRVQALKKAGVTDIEPLQIDADKLLRVAKEKSNQTANMAGMLGGKLRDFVVENPITYANDEIERELQKGSVVISDDAEYQMGNIDEDAFQWIKKMADEHGGGFIITIPRALDQLLKDGANKDLPVTYRRTLLQRIDSISFPFESSPKRFDTLDDGLKQMIAADITSAYRRSEQFHHSYLREQQLLQWKDCIRDVLVQGGEKFGTDTPIGKLIAQYFTDEKINELITNYPMNPRYIRFTIDSLAILLSNRRNQNLTLQNIDFMLKAILERDTFKNYVRSIDYRITDASPQYNVVDTSRVVYKSFIDHVSGYLSLGFKETEKKQYSSAKDLLLDVMSASQVNMLQYNRQQIRVGSACMSRHDSSINISNLQLLMPDLEIKGQNGAVYRVVFAVDPANPNKLYRGYIQEGSDVDTITLNAVCNTANKNADLQSFLQVK